ncbi:aminoglycoside phosphotransferase family protein [Phenylobacterium sp.]|uniref:aminoglycoside phosphotransferase family protein n=1 Tax=Phenylobacterium sp. TaxID=1871053 RepID=UPI0035AEB7F6
MSGPSFQPWLARWGLVPDGDAFVTDHTGSWLLPVQHAGAPAMLKIASAPEEIAGGALMEWWGGEGAARVLAREAEALLLERAVGPASLADMASHGRDDEATTIICEAVERLHRPRGSRPPVSLVPLEIWFRQLAPTAAIHGGVLAKADAVAKALMAAPRDIVALHGDVHHGNILDFGPRGWLAIDPKGLLGERGYDYANTFCNPDTSLGLQPGRLQRRLGVVAQRSGQAPRRVLQWILAYSALSAAWMIDAPLNGETPDGRLAIAELAAAELGL